MLFGSFAFAQTGNARVDKLSASYSKLAYQDVIDDAKLLLRKKNRLNEVQQKEVYTKIAYSLFNINDYRQAEIYFQNLVNFVIEDREDAGILLKYAQVLAGNGKSTLASEVWARYSDAIEDNKNAKDFAALLKNTDPITRNVGSFETQFLGINTKLAEFSPVRYDGGLVFVSNRASNTPIKRVFAWDDSPFLDLYFLEDENLIKTGTITSNLSSSTITKIENRNRTMGSDFYTPETANDGSVLGYKGTTGFFDKPKIDSDRLSKSLNSIYHEGPCQFFNDEKSVIFTRNGVKGLSYNATDDINRVHLFLAEKSEGNWGSLASFPFNSSEYSTGHPAFMKNESVLFFVSDQPGGFGGTDIYYSKYEDGRWFEPVNAGSSINSSGNEMFPYVDENNILYFSSNGHPGLGGLDIFSIPLSFNAFPSGLVRNLGAPLNSSNDDFGILTDGDLETGYFSSNRKRGAGDDDIYSFKRLGEKYGCKDVLLALKANDTQNDLAGLKVSFYEISNPDSREEQVLNSKGESTLCLRSDAEYYFEVTEKGFEPVRQYFSTFNLSDFKVTNLSIFIKAEEEIKEEENLELPPRVMGREKDLSSEYRYRGVIYDKSISGPLSGVKVRFVNKCSGLSVEIMTKGDGRYDFSRNFECDYEFIAMKSGYATNYEFIPYNKRLITKVISPIVSNRKTTESFFDPKIFKVGDVVKLDNIYYETKDYQLATSSKNDLDQLVKVMDAYPQMIIEIFSHTDSRGNSEENLELSQKRANEVKDYLIKKGVSKLRMRAIGVGENFPVNKCGDGIQCTEGEYRRNRRTEFKILQISRI
ncbi:MAG: outer membrane protein OmpA-like peptidoglycan-associated protein [Arcticibacterium sp.]|jgi:outer membrane protein OmpA-like peptidoglycan-associated protein